MIKREWVQGVYRQERDKIDENREIGLWLVEHKDEFKNDIVMEDLADKVAKASGFSIDKIIVVIWKCSLFGLEKVGAKNV